MELPQVNFGSRPVSRVAVGGNPFSGIGHQTPAFDQSLRDYYTTARLKETLFQAEEAGITTAFMRADAHIMRLVREYWNEGGKIQWFAQHAPEHRNILDNIRSAQWAGAAGIYIQGGLTDQLQEQNRLGEVREALELIRKMGLPCGIAGHQPKTHLDAQALGLDFDFHLVCFYNLTGRRGKIDSPDPEGDKYFPADRDRAATLLGELTRPCAGYKIMAAGRNKPEEAIPFAVRHLKPTDIVIIGFFPKDRPNEIRDDVRIFLEALAGEKARQESAPGATSRTDSAAVGGGEYRPSPSGM